MIRVNHLSFTFGSNWVLKDINFHVQEGEFIFLNGPSGAGKTTLLRILHGSFPLQRGRGLVAGFDLSRISSRKLPKLRRSVSVVYQDFKVLSDRSVWANVALPLEVIGVARDKIYRRVAAVLRGLNMENKSGLFCKWLSGGEQQRVAIARAIVVRPKLLLADEPTGNLDEELSLRLLEIFKQFNKYGTTIVFASHNKRLIDEVKRARVLNLRDGVLISE